MDEAPRSYNRRVSLQEAGAMMKLTFVAVVLVGFTSLMSARRASFAQAPQALHAPDGGTRETITSIAVPPMPNAPFTATVETEWTKYLADGSNQVTRNHRLIARDGLGRVFQERRTFVSKSSPIDPTVWRTELAEPSTHTVAYCDTRSRTCELRPYLGPPSTAPATGASVNLGSQLLSGLELIGTRETQTLRWSSDSDRPLVVVKEFWYSKQLGINVLTTRDDPRSGKEVFIVKDIRQGEPDAALFVLPAGFRVADLRAALTK
jgi:hypothetical protein